MVGALGEYIYILYREREGEGNKSWFVKEASVRLCLSQNYQPKDSKAYLFIGTECVKRYDFTRESIGHKQKDN